MTLLGLFDTVLAVFGLKRRASIPPRASSLPPSTRGRSLLNDPDFLALARAYEERIVPTRRATVRDVTEGHWYALVLEAGNELAAIHRVANATWLPTYVPQIRELRRTRRGAVAVRRALFTGYGFVQTADIEAFYDRIKSCDGVLGVMCENGKPAIVRAGYDGPRKGQRGSLMLLDHGLIEFIRKVENGENSWLLKQFDRRVVNVSSGRQRKRNRRRSKRARARALAGAAS